MLSAKTYFSLRLTICIIVALHETIFAQTSNTGFILISEASFDAESKPISEIDISYNINCTVKEKIKKDWDAFDTQKWIYAEKTVYQYDSLSKSNHNLLSTIEYRWIEDEWIPNWKNKYVYEANKLKELVRLRWNDNEWLDVSKEVYSYQGQNKKQTDFWLYENNQWVQESKITYLYNDKGKVVQELLQLWEDTKLTDYSKTVYLYDQEDNLKEELYQWVNDAKWEPSERVTYKYLNQKLQQIVKSNWDISVWVENQKTELKYDLNDNIIELIDFVPVDEEWIVEKKTVNIYNPCSFHKR